ncbi:hypothetical protein WA026_020187 [Henosepilachna vigintioctopunctata]|uniref:DUF4604 domain-containing protein n=1 Tax=Henosepilachna vigintioctopunctata TaxID=420089 RepID=A0AAW1UB74_9CUCU
MSNKHITYIKPKEPNFLREIKKQAGYKEGPTVDTKREQLELADDRDFEDNEEEQPTVVVLKSGDLTAEEATREKEQLNREAASAPADLSKPIIFKAPSKTESSKTSAKSKKRLGHDSAERKTKKVKNNRLLSFDEEQSDEN